MKNKFNKLSFVLIGFTIGNGLLFFVNKTLYNNIIYHYSDDVTWYFLFYLLPLFIGLFFYSILKNKTIPKRMLFVIWIISIIQLLAIIIGSILNNQYWGYSQKRPSVFSEIENVKIVSSCVGVSNVDSLGLKSTFFIVEDAKKTLDCLYGRDDYYYSRIDRVFTVFQDKSAINIYSNDFSKILNNKKIRPDIQLLTSIYDLINESDLIKKGKFREYNSKVLNGFFTEFITSDSLKYGIACLNGSEVSNDHYPYYEFLFSEKNGKIRLLKEQRFYVDIAGHEGLEFANVLPYFSLRLVILGFIIIVLVEIVFQIIVRIRIKK